MTEEDVTVIVKIKRVTNCQGEATWIAVNQIHITSFEETPQTSYIPVSVYMSWIRPEIEIMYMTWQWYGKFHSLPPNFKISQAALDMNIWITGGT